MKILLRFFYSQLLLVIFSSLTYAQRPLEVRAENVSYILTKENIVWLNNAKQYSPLLADVIEKDSLFNNLENNSYSSADFPNNRMWFRVKIKPRHKHNIYMLFHPTNADTITLYSRDTNNHWQASQTGRLMPFSKRAIPIRNYTLELPYNGDTVQTYYIHIIASFPYSGKLIVCDQKSIIKDSHNENIHTGIFYGVNMLIVLINILMFIANKQWAYIWYAIYLFIISSTIGVSNGSFHEWFFYDTPQYNQYALIFSNIGSLAAGLFTVDFLDLKLNQPKLYRIMRYVFYGYIISFFVGCFGYITQSLFASLALAQTAITIGIIGAIRAFNKKNPKYNNIAIILYLLGWLTLGISIGLFVETSMSPSNDVISGGYIFYIGLSFDALLMTLAISFRVIAIRKEKDEATQNMMQTLREKQQLVFEQNQLLEQSVSFRSQELQTALEREQEHEEQARTYTKKLELSNKELTDFAHIVSHDLKAPLRNIAAFTDLLRRRNQDKFDERDNEFMNFIIRSSKQAMQLVEDLLSFARIDKNLGEPQVIKLNDLFDILFANLTPFLTQHHACLLKKGNLPIITAHQSVIIQLFQHLIINGITYNNSEKPTVEIGTQLMDRKTIFWVRDNGIGIPPQYHEEIFKMFHRLHPTEKYPGSGIGLAFCRKIVTIYEGEIWLSSEENKGTTFFFTLPKVAAT